jgi:ribose transport system ATP-binding protein
MLAGPALRVEGVSKTFTSKRVLSDASIEIAAGETRGLVGQNGSGKSTFIKILSGVYSPDSGGILHVFGQRVSLPLGPTDPLRLGMAFVHQDLGLFEAASVLENLRIGRYRTGIGWHIRWRAERRACRDALAWVGLDVDPDTPIRALSQVDRALVAIARAFDQAKATGERGVLVLDEATSYLPRDGVEKVFAAVGELKRKGFAILFVSHRIEEVLALCDTITVLRDGRIITTLKAEATTEDEVVEAMLGRALSDFYPEHGRRTEDVVLSVANLTGAGIHDLNFDVCRGEIYGVTGLLGMGQESLLYLLAGAVRATGDITIAKRRLAMLGLSTRSARRAGIAFLPADRLKAGGVQEASARENVTLATLSRFVRGGRIRRRAEKEAALGAMREFNVQPVETERPLRMFSGGNQQKLLLAKWLATRPAVLLLHEPTHGVDVGSQQQIFADIRSAADSGTAVVIATTEYEELAGLCDRVLVLREGRRAAELSGAALTDERLVEECYRAGRADG